MFDLYQKLLAEFRVSVANQMAWMCKAVNVFGRRWATDRGLRRRQDELRLLSGNEVRSVTLDHIDSTGGAQRRNRMGCSL